MVIIFMWHGGEPGWEWEVDGEEWRFYPNSYTFPNTDQTISWLINKLKEQCNDKSRSNSRKVPIKKTEV